MARSMTGFGIGRAGDSTLSVVVEARSVNNRFLDLSLRLPKGLFAFEAEIRELVRGHAERGRVTLTVTEEWTDEATGDVRLDRSRALHYARLLKELRDLTDSKGEVTLDHLLAAGSDLFISAEDDEYRRRLWELSKAAITSALAAMADSARREGERLSRDLDARLTTVRGDLETVKSLSAGQSNEYRQRLNARLAELLDDSRLDRNRLETEVAIAADRLDITEEIVRLSSHLELFAVTLRKDGGVGKTLNFVLQEMGREVNTIASKSWLFEIAQTAVRMKETLEQIREQVQNIE